MRESSSFDLGLDGGNVVLVVHNWYEMLLTLNVIYIVLSPFLILSIGSWFLSELYTDKQPPAWLAFSAGFLVHASLLFFCWQITASMVTALVLANVPALFGFKTATRITVTALRDMNFLRLLWFTLVVCTGVTLFDSRAAIVTPWVNNYGDLTFHMGMITSFAKGGNMIPEYHLFPGVRLTYPFLLNLCTASLWWVTDSYQLLSFIFLLQWAFFWFLIYGVLSGDRNYLLPWALFWGGGTYALLGEYSWEYLNKGYPWTVFLSTIWVTQRTALAGVALGMTVFRLVLEACESDGRNRDAFLFSGILLGLLPLVHAHSFMVTALVVGFYLLFSGNLVQVTAERLVVKPQEGAVFVLASLIACLFFPWLLGKSGMLSFTLGWTVGHPKATAVVHLVDAMLQWGRDAGVWLALLVAVGAFSKAYAATGALLLVFLLGNFVSTVQWEWDQIKIFVALYALFLALWSTREAPAARRLQYLSLLLCLPALVEVGHIMQQGNNYVVYSAASMEVGRDIELLTEPDAIIAGAPDHNSPITLTGRRIYHGYEGTLSSHRLPFKERKEHMRSLKALAACAKEASVCPDYLLWTTSERKYWKGQTPGRSFTHLENGSLYRIEG